MKIPPIPNHSRFRNSLAGGRGEADQFNDSSGYWNDIEIIMWWDSKLVLEDCCNCAIVAWEDLIDEKLFRLIAADAIQYVKQWREFKKEYCK